MTSTLPFTLPDALIASVVTPPPTNPRCTITGVLVDLTGAPLANYRAQATSDQPILEQFSGIWFAVATGTYLSAITAVDGSWSLTLPWPSVCSPQPRFLLVLPDGSLIAGRVPEGVASATVHELRTTYGWL